MKLFYSSILFYLLSNLFLIAQCDLSASGIGNFDGANYSEWNYFNSAGGESLGFFSQETTNVQAGSSSVKIEVNTAHNWGMRMFHQCNFPLTHNNYYTVSFWLKGEVGKVIKVAMQHLDGGTVEVVSEFTVSITNDDWDQYVVTFQSNGDYNSGKFKFTFPNTGIFYLDEVVVVENEAVPLKFIAPDSPHIRYSGVADLNLTNTAATMFRFPQAYATSNTQNNDPFVGFTSAARAAASAGISIEFITNSSSIRVKFRELTTYTGGVFTLAFAVYKNGKLFNVFNKTTDDVELSLNDMSGKTNHWRITMPSYGQIQFLGLDIEQTDDLITFPTITDDRPVYVAIGNSITQGMGQTNLSSHLSYPWQVADSLGFQLYNWGIGGSKINEIIFENFSTSGIQPDVVSVLWGYNDINCSHANCNTDTYIKDYTLVYYSNLMYSLASTFPNAAIVGILPTYSTTSAESGVRSLDFLRYAQDSILTELQKVFNNIYFFNGNDVTDAASLSDNVHLNDAGATQLAHRLIEELLINNIITNDTLNQLILRSEYVSVSDMIADINDPLEGHASYNVISGNENNYYLVDPLTGIVKIANPIPDKANEVHLDTLKVQIGTKIYALAIADAYDYFILNNTHYTVIEEHQGIVAEPGNFYTPYNNLWGINTPGSDATNGIDYRMAILVHEDNPDSTIFIWDTPSKAQDFGGASIWSYQNIFWGSRYNVRDEFTEFPIRIGDIQSLILSFDYEQLFGNERYKIALNQFMNEEDYVNPFYLNDGDFFMVFDQIGDYIPPYQDNLGDTIIGGKLFVMLHDSTGTIQENNDEGYQMRRVIIRNSDKLTNATIDLKKIYNSFTYRNFLDETLYFSNIQFGIEITEGWGAVRLNNFNIDYQKKIISTQSEISMEGIKIYPNPTFDKVYLSESMQYQVFNSKGEFFLQGKGQEIDLTNFSSGLYFISTTKGSVKVIKM